MFQKLFTYSLGVVFLFSVGFSCQNSGDHEQPKPIVSRLNARDQINKPTVVMISIDGFRADYLETYRPPTLLAWANNGIRSDGLVPSFPTLTFPNHVSLVTGLRPGNHGIVGNKFYDEKRKEYYSMGDGKAVNDAAPRARSVQAEGWRLA